MLENWRPIILNIVKNMKEQEQHDEIIRDIDERIKDCITNKTSNDRLYLQSFLWEVVVSLKECLLADFGDFYIDCDKRALSIRPDDEISELSSPVLINKEIRDALNKTMPQLVSIETFLSEKPEEATALLLPIHVKEKSFGFFLFSSSLPEAASHLSSPDSLQFAQIVCPQVEIAVEVAEGKCEEDFRGEVIKAFFDSKLDMTETLQRVTDLVVPFLPDIGPLKIEPAPLAQLLTYKSGNKYLSVVATAKPNRREDDFEHTPIHLDIEKSICGRLVSKNLEPSGKTSATEPYINVDPTDDPEHFRWFLLQKSKTKPRSELVVSIEYESELIAIINLEHSEKDIFLQQHIDCLVRMANFISPFLWVSRQKEDEDKNREMGMLYALHHQLTRLRSILSHDVGNVMTELLLEADLVLAKDLTLSDSTRKSIEDIYQGLDRIKTSSLGFIDRLPEFIIYGSNSLKELIDKALAVFSKVVLEEEKIEIKVTWDNCPEDIQVFSSHLLAEHIRNLVENSHYSVREAIASRTE
ncbi:hypothetical protein ES703_09320 [subsurface metagenome]